MRGAGLVLLVLAIIYVASYLTIRQTRQEVWAQDGVSYVIFPERTVAIYYIFRPLSLIDNKLTGQAFHIGPHQ